MTLVKVCGLSEVRDALSAAEAGVDFIGMVFAESRRKVTPQKALEIANALEKAKLRPERVGVFAGFSSIEVNRMAQYCRLGRAQLSGRETWEYCLQIRLPIAKSLHISPETKAELVEAAIEDGCRALARRKDVIFLLDTTVGNALGGTGTTFDWDIAKKVAARFRIMVAGGLDSDNVGELIKEVHPWAVDVSSGVEAGGRKSGRKIRDFVEAVRRADDGAGVAR